MAVVNIPSGAVIGRLTVEREGSPLCKPYATLRRYWCQCACGQRKLVRMDLLRRGDAQSCGCITAERNNLSRNGATKNGKQTPTYLAWVGMRQRCLNPRDKAYRFYGEKGVSICERWSDFRTFLADMGEKPAGYTLDRINPAGNYEPGNCQWATWAHQRRNKRNSKLTPEIVAEIKGRCAAGQMPKEIAAALGVSSASVSEIKRGTQWKDIAPKPLYLAARAVAA